MRLLMFWKNPEFVRHLRTELRTTRALAILAVVLVICILVWLGCYGSQQAVMEAYHRANHLFSPERLAQLEQQSPIRMWFNFYCFLTYAQLAALTFWSLLSCAQSISGERERKTWDFQRATRLSPGEFLIGKLLGEPIVAYFIVLCCLPITLVAGLLGHTGIGNILSAYLFILSGSLFAGLAGLSLSNLFETRSRGIGLIGTFGLYILLAFASTWANSSFPGSAAFSPLTGLNVFLGGDHPNRVATIFGATVPWLAMSLLLYSTFGAWLVVMILRGLKKDFDQINPLSRWQAVACATFLNFTGYALFQPHYYDTLGGRMPLLHSEDFAKFMVTLNGFVLFAMGLAMITPYDRLKIWWRSRTGIQSLFDGDGPPWPWLIVSGMVGYALLVWGMFAWKNDVGFDTGSLLSGLLQSITVLIFVISNILFLQWCRLTRMRAPVLKGFLYLALYYIAALVLSIVFGISSQMRAETVFALLTPVGAFEIGPSKRGLLPEVIAGLVSQLVVIFVLLNATAFRLRRTAATLARPAEA